MKVSYMEVMKEWAGERKERRKKKIHQNERTEGQKTYKKK